MSPDEHRYLRILLTVALLVLGVWIIHVFIPALLWALVIAIVTWPLYQRLAHFRFEQLHPAWGATAFTLLVGTLLLLPLGLVAVQFLRDAQTLSHWLIEAQKSGMPAPDWLGNLPIVGASASTWWQENLAEPGSLGEWLRQGRPGPLVELSRTFGTQLLRRFVTFLFTLLTLFFLYLHGSFLARATLSAISRALGEVGERYVGHAVSAVRATLEGLVLVGLGEGVLFGIAYAVVGLPHAALLGGLTGLFGMIPFAAPIVFGAAALILFAQGSVVPAIAIFAFGTVVLFVADHFVRPSLIGGTAHLPFLWVLLGILGGLETFGLVGLFVGPAVLAILISIWRDWIEQ